MGKPSDEEEGEEEERTAATLRVIRRAGCPVLTANGTLVELSMEQQVMEEEGGFHLMGMARNPFPFPVPAQSPAAANAVFRKNEWLALYVPRPMAGGLEDMGKQSGAAGGGGAGASGSGGGGGGKRSGSGGGVGGKKQKR